MNGMNDLSLDRIVEILAAKGREGEYWDISRSGMRIWRIC